ILIMALRTPIIPTMKASSEIDAERRSDDAHLRRPRTRTINHLVLGPDTGGVHGTIADRLAGEPARHAAQIRIAPPRWNRRSELAQRRELIVGQCKRHPIASIAFLRLKGRGGSAALTPARKCAFKTVNEAIVHAHELLARVRG